VAAGACGKTFLRNWPRYGVVTTSQVHP
jgi:hypothetical protein